MDGPCTDEARELLQLANQAAQHWKREYVGTEHILLGLIEQDESVAINALKELKVDPAQLRNDLERLLQPGPCVVGNVKLPYSLRAKKALEYAVSHARLWRVSSVGSGDILVGLLYEKGVAAQVLLNRGVTLPAIRAAIVGLQGRSPELVSTVARRRFTYEHFTDRARKVMQLANQEAQRLNHEYIGTEHVLLGLIKEGSGVAAVVLKNLGVDLQRVRQGVDKVVQRGPDVVSMPRRPQTPRTKKIVEYAMEDARNLNHNYVGTEHLLLGLLREQEGVAAQVLMNAGLGLQEVRDEVIRSITAGIRSSSKPPTAGPWTWGAPIDDLPNEVKAVVEELEAEIDRLGQLKEEAVVGQDFERAAARRDEADKLARQRKMALGNWADRHPVDASWLSGGSGVLRLAQQIAERRSWDELPRLADALEQAGCTDAEMLSHCRGAAEHSSHCWVVNLLLAKAAAT